MIMSIYQSRKQTRSKYFDSVKGILILAVVAGHIMPENRNLHIFLYAWHMPCFFIVNGILLKRTNFRQRLFFGVNGIFIRGIRKMIFPYYLWGGSLLIVRWLASNSQMSVLKWQVIDLLTFSGIGATWFLPCIFLAQLIVYIELSAKVQHQKTYMLVLLIEGICCLLLGMFLTIKFSVMLVARRALVGSFFCICGWIISDGLCSIRKFEHRKDLRNVIFSVVICIIFFVMTGKNEASLNSLQFGNPVLFVVNAFLGSAMILIIACYLHSDSFIQRLLCFYGENSLVVMGSHQILMLLLHIPISERYGMNVLFFVIISVLEVPIVLLCQLTKNMLEHRFNNVR